MPAVYEHALTVRPDEIDEQGHVGNVHYVSWMQAAAVAHSSAQGWTPQRYQDVGAGWVVRSHLIEYLQPAFEGERVVVRTWVADFRKVTSLRKYRILRPADGALLARAETNWAFITRDTGAPRRVPPELAESFQVVAGEGDAA
jgi:acyl-CoA thioester hydrolase